MCNSENTVTMKTLVGRIEASPLIVKNDDNPTVIYEGIRSTLQKYPEYFMFTTFSGNLKHVPTKLKEGDELKIHCCALGETREDQEIINETYHAIFDNDVNIDVSFASLLALKIVFGIKRGVAFLELANSEDVALVILEDVSDGVIIVASANDDGEAITVTETFDLFECYKEIFTTCSNELKKENITFSEDDEENGFIEWVDYNAKLATQYNDLLNSDSEQLKVLQQKIKTMTKEKYDMLLSTVRSTATSKRFIDPIDLIESV